MKLYHGTSSCFLDIIETNGIEPRGNRETNWEDYPSRPDLVYLSTVYPFYFAIVAANEKKGEIPVVFEVDTDFLPEDQMLPDEDFISQSIGHKEGISFQGVHDAVREGLEGYQHHWEDSIEGLGNAAYKGTVPLEAITRVCLFTHSKRGEVAMMMLDPTISILNYYFCRDKYIQLVGWMFGDEQEIPYSVWGQHDPADVAKMEGDFLGEQRAFWEKESRDRTGVEVRQYAMAR